MIPEPIRLVNDASVRDELRQKLARETAMSVPYDVERGLVRLRTAIATGADGPTSGVRSSSEPPSFRLSVTSYAVKGSVWKVAGVVGLATLGAVLGVRAWAPARHVGRIEAARPGSAATRAPSQAESSSSEEERANLAQIRALLATDPQGALALSEEGNRRFAGGLLHEDREASAVRALMILGQGEQARRRALLFVQDHPEAP